MTWDTDMANMIKWNRSECMGVFSKDRKWFIQASRDINGKPITWSLFDNTKDNMWLDDRIGEFDKLAEAKAYAQESMNYYGTVC